MIPYWTHSPANSTKSLTKRRVGHYTLTKQTCFEMMVITRKHVWTNTIELTFIRNITSHKIVLNVWKPQVFVGKAMATYLFFDKRNTNESLVLSNCGRSLAKRLPHQPWATALHHMPLIYYFLYYKLSVCDFLHPFHIRWLSNGFTSTYIHLRVI